MSTAIPLTNISGEFDPVHILIASLARGGAERLVCETVDSLQRRGVSGNLFVLWNAGNVYQFGDTPHFRFFPATQIPREQKLQVIAERILNSTHKLVLTHLIPARDLKVLWAHGVQTAPVIHNARLGWQDAPDAFANPLVPFLVAASCDTARELRESGWSKPIVVVRHELQRWFTPAEIQSDRIRIRKRYGIGEREFLIGMVGNFKAQKAYPRAVRVLEQLLRVAPARLMILGAWDHEYGYGHQTYETTRQLARDLEVDQALILPGGVPDVEAHYAAFDAFLNTSIFEGLSIAMLEAQQAGCPVVTANAGGNVEALVSGSQVVYDSSEIQPYVDALLRVRNRRNAPPAEPAYPDLIPQLWRQLALYSSPPAGDRIIFVTDSLNSGGATRSLVNLLTRFEPKDQVVLCVLGLVHNRAYLDELEQAAVRTVRFESPANVVECAERILLAVNRLNAGTLCFWNVDASVKLLTAKVLSPAATRIVDVSPGPQLFSELTAVENFQERIAFSAENYFDRLDCFVAKYQSGVPPAEYNVARNKIAVIPNGVPCPLESQAVPFPARFAEAYRMIACCRLAQEKRVEFLIDSAAQVAKRMPQSSLTVVGGPERGDVNYATSLARRAERRGLNNAWFTGRQSRVTPFLHAGRVFVTASLVDGCSNAIIEAMAAGLPVVATETPAVIEQIENGVTGFIVSQDRTEEMAERVEALLVEPDIARALGDAGRRRAQEHFSIDRMVQGYAGVLANRDRVAV